MNKNGFTEWMNKTKKSQLTIKRNIEYVNFFQKYLSKSKSKKIEDAKPKDLEDFKIWNEKSNLKHLRMYLRSLVTYYQYTNNVEMLLKAKELVGSAELERYKLSDFHGIDKDCITTLKNNGFKTAKQLLDIGYTKKGRKKLSEATGLAQDFILELVKLSDLARIPGVKKIRARLYHDAGLDTLVKMAKCDTDKLIKISKDFIEKSGFNGVPPTPKEAEHTVTMAKYLKKHLRL
ncbi:MAG: DUF4332 domain-containing protein [Desulfobacteraceae bacterium]|jgi:hypothetical protein